MPKRIHLYDHLTVAELERRYRTTTEPRERAWWHVLWLLAQGQTAHQAALATGCTSKWVGRITRRYNEQGPDGMHNWERRHLDGGQIGQVCEPVYRLDLPPPSRH